MSTSLEASQGRVPRHSSQLASEHLILLQPENGANTGLGDLARPPATPKSATVRSPVQIFLLPLCPDPAISLKEAGKIEHADACHGQPSHFNRVPNQGLSDLPCVLLTPALLAANLLSHSASWYLLSSRNCPQFCRSSQLPIYLPPSVHSLYKGITQLATTCSCLHAE